MYAIRSYYDITVTNEAGEVVEKGPRIQFKEVLSIGFTVTFWSEVGVDGVPYYPFFEDV